MSIIFFIGLDLLLGQQKGFHCENVYFQIMFQNTKLELKNENSILKQNKKIKEISN